MAPPVPSGSGSTTYSSCRPPKSGRGSRRACSRRRARSARRRRAQVLDLMLEERPVGDRQHRLGRRVRQGAKARALAAHQDDRDHERRRPIPASRSTSAGSPAGRPTRRRTRPPRAWRGSSRLRPSTMSGVAIASRVGAAVELAGTRPTRSRSRRRRRRSRPRAASRRARRPRPARPARSPSPPGRSRRTSAPSARRRDGQHEARRLAHVVGVRLERQAEQRDPLAAQLPQVPLQLGDRRGASGAR